MITISRIVLQPYRPGECRRGVHLANKLVLNPSLPSQPRSGSTPGHPPGSDWEEWPLSLPEAEPDMRFIGHTGFNIL